MTDPVSEITDELRDGILWITFQRPQARNALTFGMYERLAQLCRDMPTHGAVRRHVGGTALDRRRHGISSIHSTTGACSRASIFNNT